MLKRIKDNISGQSQWHLIKVYIDILIVKEDDVTKWCKIEKIKNIIRPIGEIYEY